MGSKHKHIDKALQSSTLAALVREAAKSLGHFDLDDIDAELVRRYGNVPTKYLVKIKKTIFDFCRYGEVERAESGESDRYRYIYVGNERRKIDTIWHLVRSGRRVSTTELVKLSGAKRKTVKEYLCFLVSLGHVQRVKPGHFLLINDPGPKTPFDEEKRQRLRRIRKNQKPKAKDLASKKGCKVIKLSSRQVQGRNKKKAADKKPEVSDSGSWPDGALTRIARELFNVGFKYTAVEDLLNSIRRSGIDQFLKEPELNLSKFIILFVDAEQIRKDIELEPKNCK